VLNNRLRNSTTKYSIFFETNTIYVTKVLQEEVKKIMRQMMKEFEEKPTKKSEDNRLDLKSMPKKERRKKEKEILKETMEDMNSFEKFKYLLYYHKERLILIGIIAILIVSGSISIYKATRPTSISYGVINCLNQMEFNSLAIEQYTKDIGKYNGYQIKENINLGITRKDYEQNSGSQQYINFLTLSNADYYDVLFTDAEGVEFCSEQGVFNSIDGYLDKEHYEIVKNHIFTTKDKDGNIKGLAIDISDTEFAKSLNIGYDDVYIGFPGNSDRNHTAVNDLLDYLFK
jgi:hypothetical protein